MRVTSSPGAETHSDCVSGATLVKRFAYSLEVAGSVGRCAPTDPDRFFWRSASLLRFRNRIGSATVALSGIWSIIPLSAPWYWAWGTTLIGVVAQFLTAIAFLQSFIVRKARFPAFDI